MKTRRQLSSIGAALTLGVLAVAGTSVIASATTGPLIPAGATGSLTIHKFEQPVSYGPDSQGMPLPESVTAGLTPFEGVTFQAQKVEGVDLFKNAGWQQAQQVVDGFDAFSPTTSLSGQSLGPTVTDVTRQDGTATLDLPVGLYLVRETATPPMGPGQTVTPAMPFLVTIPLTDPTGRQNWIYDVHVYPKNVVSAVEKTVNDGNVVAAGQNIEYSISNSIPGGSVTEKYVVTDHLDPKLSYRSAQVEINGAATSDFDAVHSNGTLTVSLGATARQAAFKALSGNPEAKVVVKVIANVTAAGEIDNDATLTFNRADELDTELTSTPATTKFGGIQVQKTTREGSGLEGAVFEVWASHKNDFTTATRTTVNGVSSWSTPASGHIEIDGLRYSAWANGSAVDEGSDVYLHYWLVETKAPVGFELLPEPIPFVIDSQVATSIQIDVINTPHNATGELPLTGGSGLVGLIGAGLLVMGGGVYGLRRSSRMHESRTDASH